MLVCSALLYEGQLQKKVWTERRQIFTNDLIKALGNGEFFFFKLLLQLVGLASEIFVSLMLRSVQRKEKISG